MQEVGSGTSRKQEVNTASRWVRVQIQLTHPRPAPFILLLTQSLTYPTTCPIHPASHIIILLPAS